MHEECTVNTTNCYFMRNGLRDVYCLFVNKNKVCNVELSSDRTDNIQRMCDVCYVKVIDIVNKGEVFMEHILLPGSAARIR